MCDSTSNPHRRRRRRRREPPLYRRRHWCCSFTEPPLSPENTATKKTDLPSSNTPSPHSQQKLHLARRILSPGRVSPISDVPPMTKQLPAVPKPTVSEIISNGAGDFDVRLNLKGRNGESLVLEMSSEVLGRNSSVFADLIADYRRNLTGLCRIEVPNVENLSVFRETVELMFEEDVEKRLLKIGVYRVIDILEVSAGIKFGRGVSSCLKYLEAVPWTEEEEEKLRELFVKVSFDDGMATDILDRLFTVNSVDSQRSLAKQLIWSVTTCNDVNARNEMKSLVKGLLCKSSVYEKEYPYLNRDDIFAVCDSCLSSLTNLLEGVSGADSCQKSTRNEKAKPLLDRVSKQVDNLNWMLEILLDHQMAEEFVGLWANQLNLLKLHKIASPMVRYELSRVSAVLFIALGTRKLHCRTEMRVGLLQTWFRPMLSDFGWLQRCRKGIDIKALEEAMGQTLLTLPLKEQYVLFMEWFECFSKNGSECPNLSKAFQIWWRRSSFRSTGSGLVAAESR